MLVGSLLSLIRLGRQRHKGAHPVFWKPACTVRRKEEEEQQEDQSTDSVQSEGCQKAFCCFLVCWAFAQARAGRGVEVTPLLAISLPVVPLD